MPITRQISLFVNREEVAATFQDSKGHTMTSGEQQRQRIPEEVNKRRWKVEEQPRPGTISPRNPKTQGTRGELRRRPRSPSS
ncbi:hypothetical protein GCK72_015343 [Caenorhabditis remanei]|uniref:Uncharacterized protein n=1 Tax=Caenorhabditis remanei TaxID=31234 RepID=A0A6A5GWT7_CAERE|nr:hypothetical protein GCK72_015343 [Caenorhabditis remanei]KAF1758883.1 hypothetical protein GCK72_015343 [Caenorhabditis remanei]